MNKQRRIELYVGLFVVLTIISLAAIAFKTTNFSGLKQQSSYHVSALFENIGSLKVRAPITLSGVVVGRVDSIAIDKRTLQARVGMSIYDNYKIFSIDTSASILTSGLLGAQFIGLDPGGDDDILKEGDEIELTQSALVLEELIGRFLTSTSDNAGSE